MKKTFKTYRKYIYFWIFYIAVMIFFVFIKIDSNWLLLLPIALGLFATFTLVKIKNKKQRNVIKSSNDIVLFLVSAITTSFLTLKTIENNKIDLFDIFMKNNIGYMLICFYSIMLFIKAYMAFLETKDNLEIEDQ